MMEVVVLGSGAAKPQIGRANACYLVRTDVPLLFDFGSGALINMLHAGIDRNRLCHLFWSHLHTDHISDFIPFFFHEMCDAKTNPREDLAVYGPAGTRKLVRSVLRTFPGFSKARFKIGVKEIGTGPRIQIGRTLVRPHPIKHSPSLHALGYRIEYEGRTVVYSGDAAFSPGLIKLCRNADLAIVEATYPDEHASDTHLTASQACKAAQAAGVKKLVLTHFDPVWKGHHLQAQCADLFEGEIMAAEDLLQIQI
jgi:ribonuclease BN (tRNA processing enzyme)